MILVIIQEQPVNIHNDSTMYNKKYLFPALMQPSYALLPATSHPKALEEMQSSHQYAMPKSRFTSIGLKHQIIINQLGIRIQNSMDHRQAISACNHPITDQGN